VSDAKALESSNVDLKVHDYRYLRIRTSSSYPASKIEDDLLVRHHQSSFQIVLHREQ
jgi:hypothetical protein